MKINENENIVLCDIDGTLILHNYKDYPLERWITFDYYGTPKVCVAHLEQIQLLKTYRNRGMFVRAHSNNGYQWVKEVITKLDLCDYVDEGETKPGKFLDDAEVPSNEVIGQRVFIKP